MESNRRVLFEADGITFYGDADAYELNMAHGDYLVEVNNLTAFVPRNRIEMSL